MSSRTRNAALGAAGLLAGAAGFVAYAAACPRSRNWAPGFHRGPRNCGALALTFDDGPSNETPRFLDLLAEHEVRATFFVCGANVRRRPAIARKVVSAGHEIGNHTYNHHCLLGMSRGQIWREIVETQLAIEDATGVSPSLFRPPFGVRSPSLRSVLEDLGMLEVQWTVIGNDWKWPAHRIAARVIAGAKEGGIVCLHDGHGARPMADRSQTLEALEDALPLLLHRGYRTVTAGEMGAMLKLRPA
ncbi:MAG: polysaccharide deacetylase family protein [Bryobacterales bacterium]|nr:polysaccharide deacetylase family protein [Acidobacteriota bacterium]MCB9384988.1 polysaccharide deacetylase family protein [Bryobacterales bacterium]